MSIELLQTLSLASYVLGGVMLLAAIAIFILLDIKKVVGDITGSTARKAIEDIRHQNESSDNKAYKPEHTHNERGKLTDKMTSSGRLISNAMEVSGSPSTEKFDTEKLTSQAGETTVLSTTLDYSVQSSGETTVLSQESNFTATAPSAQTNTDFTVDVEMSFIGSSEFIE